MSEKKNFLEYRHPGWKMQSHWEFLIDTFEGGPEWLKKHIQKFFKEGTQEFKQRLERAYRDNISRDVIEIFTAYLFKAGIKRAEASDPAIATFISQATRGYSATDLDGFMRTVADKTSAVSPCFLVVDMPALPAELADRVVTKADVAAYRLFPYVYLLYPTEVMDFSMDEDGEFNWVIIRECYRNDADPLESDRSETVKFRVWTRTDWRLFRLDKKAAEGYALEDSGTHPVGAVPVIRVTHKDSGSPYTGISLIEEIAYKDRAIANNESRLDVIIADQTFSTLWIPDAGLIANTERDTNGKRQKMIASSTSRAALFNDAASHVPFYLAPDAAQAAVIDALITRLRTEIFEDALLGSEATTKSTGPKTATEMERDFDKLNGALGDKAAGLERADRLAIKYAALWMGIELTQDEINQLAVYPRDFNVQALSDEVAELLGIQKFSALGATFWAKAMERIIKRYFGEGITPEEVKAMVDEVTQNLDMAGLLDKASSAATLAGHQFDAANPGGDPNAGNPGA